MRLLIAITLLTSCLTAMGQASIDTESKYTRSDIKGVIIQNSFPKGGEYTDVTGKKMGYRIFWTRVINETTTPLELTIKFPTNSGSLSSSPNFYLKVFLPPGTMTLDKEGMYDYGVTGLKSFLNTGLNRPATLQKNYQS